MSGRNSKEVLHKGRLPINRSQILPRTLEAIYEGKSAARVKIDGGMDLVQI